MPSIGNTLAYKLHLFGHNCGSQIVWRSVGIYFPYLTQSVKGHKTSNVTLIIGLTLGLLLHGLFQNYSLLKAEILWTVTNYYSLRKTQEDLFWMMKSVRVL